MRCGTKGRILSYLHSNLQMKNCHIYVYIYICGIHEEHAMNSHNDMMSGMLNANFGNAVEMIMVVASLKVPLRERYIYHVKQTCK